VRVGVVLRVRVRVRVGVRVRVWVCLYVSWRGRENENETLVCLSPTHPLPRNRNRCSLPSPVALLQLEVVTSVGHKIGSAKGSLAHCPSLQVLLQDALELDAGTPQQELERWLDTAHPARDVANDDVRDAVKLMFAQKSMLVLPRITTPGLKVLNGNMDGGGKKKDNASEWGAKLRQLEVTDPHFFASMQEVFESVFKSVTVKLEGSGGVNPFPLTGPQLQAVAQSLVQRLNRDQDFHLAMSFKEQTFRRVLSLAMKELQEDLQAVSLSANSANTCAQMMGEALKKVRDNTQHGAFLLFFIIVVVWFCSNLSFVWYGFVPYVY
jgi:hypothetical protein